MEQNSITPAPQSADVDALFRKWQQDHIGRREDFYKFITTPSVERDAFLSRLKSRIEVRGLVANILYD